MKPALYFLFALVLVLIKDPLLAQSNTFSQVYKPGNSLYVYSEGGLSMRDKSDAKGAVLLIVKFGEKVEVLADTKPHVTFTSTGVPGTWVKVKQGDKEGYMFDGFLSRFPPMPRSPGYPQDFQKYLKEQFKVKTVVDTPPKKETYNAYITMTFENGITYSWIAAEGGSEINTSFPVSVYTFQEVYLIARIAYAEFFKAPVVCPYNLDSLDCSVDENTMLKITKRGANYELSYGHAD
jgi:hypothetical protein